MRILVASLLVAGAVALSAAGSPLIEAVKRQDAQAVRALLKQKANVNAAEADGFTALHWAAHLDDVRLVELLLAAGANAKAANRTRSPLYLPHERQRRAMGAC